MPKTLGFIIAIMILEVGLLFCTIIPCQLQKSFAICNGVDAIRCCLWNTLLAGVPKEIEVKLGVFVLTRSDERHSHNFLVEL